MKSGRKTAKRKAAAAGPAGRAKAARLRMRGLKWGSAAVLLFGLSTKKTLSTL